MSEKKKRMIMILSVSLVFILMILTITSNAKAVNLNTTNLTMDYKSGYKLKMKGYYGTCIWRSSNTNILTVSREGFVRAKGIGNAKITVQCGLRRYSCKIKVVPKKFHKYNLTQSHLKELATVCWREQGSTKGAAAEASLMANLYESSRGNNYSSLYKYVKYSGWFAHAKEYMGDKNAPSSIVRIVSKVLEDGKRTLPQYVDEHDCFSDITDVTTNGLDVKNISKRSNYKRHKTKIWNKYKRMYFFYSFPDSKSDPFGYTSNYNKNYMGDFCYSFYDL